MVGGGRISFFCIPMTWDCEGSSQSVYVAKICLHKFIAYVFTPIDSWILRFFFFIFVPKLHAKRLPPTSRHHCGVLRFALP
jgi:hypothetical protein